MYCQNSSIDKKGTNGSIWDSNIKVCLLKKVNKPNSIWDSNIKVRLLKEVYKPNGIKRLCMEVQNRIAS